MSGTGTVDLAAVAVSMHRGELPPGWRWVVSSPAARVATAQGVFIKLFLPRNLWEWPKQLLRGGRAARAAREGRRLAELGFLTPAVCGYGTLGLRALGFRALGFRDPGSGARGCSVPGSTQWLATRAVPAMSFGDFVTGFFDGQPEREGVARGPLYRRLGDLVGRLHRVGIIHGDLRPNNVLLGCAEDGVRFYLIDNERNRRYRRLPDKLVLKNLVQIQMQFDSDFSPAERELFFAAYGAARQLADGERDALATASRRRVAERLRGKTREGLVQTRLGASQWDFLVSRLRKLTAAERL